MGAGLIVVYLGKIMFVPEWMQSGWSMHFATLRQAVILRRD